MGFYSRFNGSMLMPGVTIASKIPVAGQMTLVSPTDLVSPTVRPAATPQVQVDYQMSVVEEWQMWEYTNPDASLLEKLAHQLARPLAGPVVLWHALAAAGAVGVGVYAYRRSKR